MSEDLAGTTRSQSVCSQTWAARRKYICPVLQFQVPGTRKCTKQKLQNATQLLPLHCDIYWLQIDQYQDDSSRYDTSCLAHYMHAGTTVTAKTKGSSMTMTTNYHTARCHILTVALRQDSYSSPNTIRKIRSAGHVARMGSSM
jgi:type II secretory pathway component PulL